MTVISALWNLIPVDRPLMPKRKSLKSCRKKAYSKQNGCCYYCGHKMWLSDINAFASKHHLTIPQARLFKCTGEHLLEHSKGGKADETNIVAACHVCNQRRHKRKKPISLAKYKRLVSERLVKGTWHANLGKVAISVSRTV